MKIICRDGPAYLLLVSGEPPDPFARVRILDPDQGALFPEIYLGSALNHGLGWIETAHDEEVMNRLLEGAQEIPAPAGSSS